MSIRDMFRFASPDAGKMPEMTIIDADIEFDPMFQEVVDEVFANGDTSPRALQQRFRIGWARACFILDQMEAIGIVGPTDGTKPRRILISKKQWRAIRSQCTNQLPF